ncbi:MAG TPA: DEAD/DEAH box helicase, partial [Gemmatales bacterium]|nr:DEAD/DEAH box helicase [Gemmatales bacterium]
RQSVLFSATMPREIEQLAKSMLKHPVRVTIAAPKQEQGLIEEAVCHVPQKLKTSLLVQMLSEQDMGRTLVFTRTKHGADRVVKQLSKAGIQSEALHGNKTQASRLRSLENLRSGRTRVVVATDVAARGIDVDNISHVFNYDLPHEPETYVHRIGRTGRAGAKGMAISFCDMDEKKYLRNIERLLKRQVPVMRAVMADLPVQQRHGEGQQPAGDSLPREQERRMSHRSGKRSHSGSSRPQHSSSRTRRR